MSLAVHFAQLVVNLSMGVSSGCKTIVECKWQVKLAMLLLLLFKHIRQPILSWSRACMLASACKGILQPDVFSIST